MRDESHSVRRDRPDRVVHRVKKKALQIGDVPRNMERHDLPLAVAQHLVAALQALKDEAALQGPVAFPHNVLVCSDVPDRKRQTQKRVLFHLRKRRAIDFQPSNEPVQRGFVHSLPLIHTCAGGASGALLGTASGRSAASVCVPFGSHPRPISLAE